MKTDTLVSIVTPSYNKGAFIEETILSIKSQTYTHVEHIVIDGGSTDGTLDILRKYGDSLTWISEPDKGQSDAINKGWGMARGEILAYLNADDAYVPWAVETAVDFLCQNPDVDMVYGDLDLIDEHANIIGQYRGAKFELVDLVCGRNMIPQPTVFFRRKVLDNVGYLDTNLHLAMDYDFWIRIGLKSRTGYIPKLLASFRLCAGTKTVEQSSKWTDDLLYILDKLFSNSALPKEIKDLKRKAYGNVHISGALKNHSLGQMRESREHFIKALIVYPPCILGNPWPSFYLAATFLSPHATKVIFRWARRLYNGRSV
jgi:glycosyltransferase involved in cell wall biosynthesis